MMSDFTDGLASDRGKWGLPGVSKRGWIRQDVEDLGAPSETCGMRESMTIRYAHGMSHEDIPVALAFSSICARNLGS